MGVQARPFSPIGLLGEEDDAVSVVMAQMDRLLSLVRAQVSKAEKLKASVGLDVDRLEAVIQGVDLKIGSDPGVSDTPLLSVWEGVAYVNTIVQEHQMTAADRAWVEEVMEVVMDARGEIRAKVDELTVSNQRIMELVGLVAEEQRLLSTKVKRTDERVAMGTAVAMGGRSGEAEEESERRGVGQLARGTFEPGGVSGRASPELG